MTTLVIDCLNCEYGCNCGPASLNSNHGIDAIEQWIERRRKELKERNCNQAENGDPELTRTLQGYWQDACYVRQYRDLSANNTVRSPNRDQRAAILRSMHKYSEQDKFNCCSCGYGSCDDMAVAIHNGMNRPENCHHYLANETKLSPDQLAFLQNQLAQLDALELTAEAVEALERDSQRVARAQELITLAESLTAGLTGEDSVQTRLAALVREAKQLAALDAASQPFADRLGSTAIELNDLGAEFAALAQSLHFDPEHAEQLQAKLNTWLDVKRRHGGDLAAVSAARDGLRSRLEAQGDLAGALARLEKQIADAERAARKEAAVLRALREKAAKELAKVAAKGIAQLGFKRADFSVRVVPLAEPGPTGDCGCEFMFSPNVGEAPLPLNRVASSGELARVMLALKTVLADLDGVPVLVFDEVDANVGGEIGRVVGEKMAAIARDRQVFCVTHLPQVAAQGDTHFVVTKDEAAGRTVVRITPLHTKRAARVAELARMLGDRSAKSALAHAEELLGAR